MRYSDLNSELYQSFSIESSDLYDVTFITAIQLEKLTFNCHSFKLLPNEIFRFSELNESYSVESRSEMQMSHTSCNSTGRPNSELKTELPLARDEVSQ